MLTLKGLTLFYPQQTKPALDNFDLMLNPGEFCTVIGHNGSGKSTLFKALCGELPIKHGAIELNQSNVVRLCAQKRAKMISSVTQDISLSAITQMSLLENVVLSLLRGQKGRLRSYKHYRQQALTLLSDLDMQCHLQQPFGCLSGGQQQTLATLMAFSAKPQLLLLDEHTSALDPKKGELLMQFTAKKVKETKITTFMITHNLSHALAYGDRLIMMADGKIVLNTTERNKLTLAQLQELFFKPHERIVA